MVTTNSSNCVSREIRTLTITSATVCQLCQQKYYWRYERGLKPARDAASGALSLGRAFHAGCDADTLGKGLARVDACFADSACLGEDGRFAAEALRAKARAMLRRASLRWPERPARREYVFNLPVVNPETGCASRSFRFAGKIDCIVGDRLVDWKTTSDPASFLAKKKLGYQLAGYAHAILASEGLAVKGALYRIVASPSIRRLGQTKTRRLPESAAAFEERCFAWLGEPGRLFEEQIPLTADSVRAFSLYLWQVTQAVLWARRTGAWLRNTSACRDWSRDCEYLPLCLRLAEGAGAEEVALDGFGEGEAHPELRNGSAA